MDKIQLASSSLLSISFHFLHHQTVDHLMRVYINTSCYKLMNSIWTLAGIMLNGWKNAQGYIQDGPEKNGTAHFPQYVEAITGISVLGIFS